MTCLCVHLTTPHLADQMSRVRSRDVEFVVPMVLVPRPSLTQELHQS